MKDAKTGRNPKNLDDMLDSAQRSRKQEGIAVVSMVEHITRAVAGRTERVMVMWQSEENREASLGI